MGMIEWLSAYLENHNTKLLYLLSLIAIANVIDFVIGWVNAKFNGKVSFSSSKAIYGIARKMILLMVCVFFIPVALLLPDGLGVGALYVLFSGYLLTEIHSILSHLKLTEDSKTVDPFINFVNRIFGNDQKK